MAKNDGTTFMTAERVFGGAIFVCLLIASIVNTQAGNSTTAVLCAVYALPMFWCAFRR
jgi:hypothetical protein